MTEFNSTTVRRTRTPFVRFGADAKRIIVKLHTLGPEDAITVRLERRRAGYTILVADLYSYLVRQNAMNKHLERARAKRKSVKRFHALTR